MGNLVLDETWCYHGEPLVDDLLLGWGFVRSRAAPLLQAIESLKKGLKKKMKKKELMFKFVPDTDIYMLV